MTNEEGLYQKQLLVPICILLITSTTPGVWGDEEETSPAFHQMFFMTVAFLIAVLIKRLVFVNVGARYNYRH